MAKKEKTTTKIIVPKNEVAGFIQQAIENKMPVETMERLLMIIGSKGI